jgi:hypothetical protein
MQKTTYENKPGIPEMFPAQHQIQQPGSQQRMNPSPLRSIRTTSRRGSFPASPSW